MKKLFILFIAIIVTSVLWATSFEVDGIAYNKLGGDSIEVISKDDKYSGSITIPATVSKGRSTFRVTRLGEQSFFGCDSLNSISIPNSVTSIGDGAFTWCYALNSITIPSSVTSFGTSVFSGCYSLSSIDVDAANTHFASIDGVLFNYAKDTLIQYPIGNARTSYTIPNSVTGIGMRAFAECTSLSSITFPNSVTSIGLRAFANCSSLTSVTLPDNLTSLEAYVFSECYSISSITFGKNLISIDISAFANCSSLTSIILPNSVKSIADRAFSYCDSLSSVTLPASLTSLGWGAFYESTNISSITCYATAPPSCGNNCFYNVDKSIPLYVPKGRVDVYKSVNGWTDFTNIQAIPDTPSALEQTLLPPTENRREVSKILQNGRLLIQKDNKTYTALGQEL